MEGRSRWATKRTSGLSMPMPKATVATITTASSRRKRCWFLRRASGIHAGMIGQRLDLALAQPGGGLVDLLAGLAIDDAGLACMIPLDDGEQLALGIRALDHAVADVRPVEGVEIDLGVVERRGACGSRLCVSRSAVAVSAMRGTAGNCSCSTESWMYSGRKSWPHCETQCASSMAKSATFTRAQQIEEARGQQPLRRHIEQLQGAPAQLPLDLAHFVEESGWNSSTAAATPICCRAATWSCISAIRGETTMPTPSRSMAGIW